METLFIISCHFCVRASSNSLLYTFESYLCLSFLTPQVKKIFSLAPKIYKTNNPLWLTYIQDEEVSWTRKCPGRGRVQTGKWPNDKVSRRGSGRRWCGVRGSGRRGNVLQLYRKILINSFRMINKDHRRNFLSRVALIPETMYVYVMHFNFLNLILTFMIDVFWCNMNATHKAYVYEKAAVLFKNVIWEFNIIWHGIWKFNYQSNYNNILIFLQPLNYFLSRFTRFIAE